MMDFEKNEVIGDVAGFPQGAFLELDIEKQGNPRRSALKRIKELGDGRAVYEIMRTVVFKKGEIVGYSGQKLNRVQCMPIETEADKAEKKKKADKAAAKAAKTEPDKDKKKADKADKK